VVSTFRWTLKEHGIVDIEFGAIESIILPQPNVVDHHSLRVEAPLQQSFNFNAISLGVCGHFESLVTGRVLLKLKAAIIKIEFGMLAHVTNENARMKLEFEVVQPRDVGIESFIFAWEIEIGFLGFIQ